MPTESALPPPLSRTPSLWSPYKCDRCGARCVAGSATTSTAPLPPSPTSPRSLGGIGRSYSDTVRFGDNRSRSFTVDITVHPDNTESENVREHADAVAELGAMICGTCATATASAEPVSPEPLTALQGTGERTLAQSNGQGHGQVHAVSAVGLGLSLGRAVVTNVLEQHVECDPARPASVSSEDSISTPDLAKLDISPICPASAAATLPITSQTISSEAAKPSVFPQSLPTPGVLPWSTARPTPAATASNVGGTSRAGSSAAEPDLGRRYRGTEDRPYQPILDATSERISNTGRGALYPGSIFKGTQTSGRSAYDVEIRFLTVNLPYSTCSGYLTITNLTDTHPMLTTFFTAELIGEKYGFLTANRWGASEHDDLRHWGRFEQFRRAETRASLIRPELFLREPVGVMSPWRSGGGVGAASPQTSHVQGMPGLQGTGPTRAREECWADVKGKDRDFVFMRIKEHFLVPDHRVKDISGASFAGFYYAMLDLTPSGDYPSPTSPTSPRTALPAQSTTSATSPTSPHAARYSYVPSSATSYASNTNHDLRERLRRRQSNQAAAAIRPSAWARRVSGPGVHDDEPEPEPGPDADADGTPDEEDFGDPTGETEIRSGSGSGDLPALGAGSGGTSAGIAGYFSSAFGRRASTATSPGMDTGTGGSGSRGAANGHVLVGPPPAGRRSSSSVIRESDLQSPTANAVPPTGPQMPPRRRRESSHRAIAEAPREATIRGYYFHSLNQEPFQELFLTHVPSKSNGTFEMR